MGQVGAFDKDVLSFVSDINEKSSILHVSKIKNYIDRMTNIYIYIYTIVNITPPPFLSSNLIYVIFFKQI